MPRYFTVLHRNTVYVLVQKLYGMCSVLKYFMLVNYFFGFATSESCCPHDMILFKVCFHATVPGNSNEVEIYCMPQFLFAFYQHLFFPTFFTTIKGVQFLKSKRYMGTLMCGLFAVCTSPSLFGPVPFQDNQVKKFGLSLAFTAA